MGTLQQIVEYIYLSKERIRLQTGSLDMPEVLNLGYVIHSKIR